MMKKRDKKGQVTIFVILAIMIILLIVLFLSPVGKKWIPSLLTFDPSREISQQCLEKNVKPIFEKALLKGGNLNPELYFVYNNESIDYVCYTSEWYKTCIMQKPFLKQAIELEVQAATQNKIDQCILDMQKKLESKGYEVTLQGTKKFDINIQPEKVLLTLDLKVITKKNEETKTFDNNDFIFSIDSNSYDMIMIASSIQNFEARYGDSVPETYMGYYPNIKVEKLKQDDGTKVYIITERNTQEKMQFATRSLAWPPGYAI